MGKFSGKVVLVTGASRGIGAAIARAFGKEKAFVIVNYLQNEEAAEKVVSSCIELGGDGWAIQADVTSESDINRMVEQILMEVGKIDIVINNAFKSFKFDPEQRKMVWDLNGKIIKHKLMEQYALRTICVKQFFLL